MDANFKTVHVLGQALHIATSLEGVNGVVTLALPANLDIGLVPELFQFIRVYLKLMLHATKAVIDSLGC